MKHKGLSHNILGIFLISAALLFLVALKLLDNYLVYGFVIGYVSHVLIDLFNPGGVGLLFPYNKRYNFTNFRC